jgi:hypothetical protein
MSGWTWGAPPVSTAFRGDNRRLCLRIRHAGHAVPGAAFRPASRSDPAPFGFCVGDRVTTNNDTYLQFFMGELEKLRRKYGEMLNHSLAVLFSSGAPDLNHPFRNRNGFRIRRF